MQSSRVYNNNKNCYQKNTIETFSSDKYTIIFEIFCKRIGHIANKYLIKSRQFQYTLNSNQIFKFLAIQAFELSIWTKFKSETESNFFKQHLRTHHLNNSNFNHYYDNQFDNKYSNYESVIIQRIVNDKRIHLCSVYVDDLHKVYILTLIQSSTDYLNPIFCNSIIALSISKINGYTEITKFPQTYALSQTAKLLPLKRRLQTS